jgi:hypothetical protein
MLAVAKYRGYDIEGLNMSKIHIFDCHKWFFPLQFERIED